jgi:hypothetical protein
LAQERKTLHEICQPEVDEDKRLLAGGAVEAGINAYSKCTVISLRGVSNTDLAVAATAASMKIAAYKTQGSSE